MIKIDNNLIKTNDNESGISNKIPLVNTIKNLVGAMIKGITSSFCSLDTIEKSRFLSAIHKKQYGIWFKHSLFLLGIPLFITNPHGGKVVKQETIHIKSTHQNLNTAQKKMLKSKENSYIQYQPVYKQEIATSAHKIETATSPQDGFESVTVQKIRDGLFSSHYACSSTDVGVQSYIQSIAKKGLSNYLQQNHNEYVLTFPTKPPKLTTGEFEDVSDVFRVETSDSRSLWSNAANRKKSSDLSRESLFAGNGSREVVGSPMNYNNS